MSSTAIELIGAGLAIRATDANSSGITEYFQWLWNLIMDCLYDTVIIDTSTNYRLKHAILQEMEILIPTLKRIKMSDSNSSCPIEEVPNGVYSIGVPVYEITDSGSVISGENIVEYKFGSRKIIEHRDRTQNLNIYVRDKEIEVSRSMFSRWSINLEQIKAFVCITFSKHNRPQTHCITRLSKVSDWEYPNYRAYQPINPTGEMKAVLEDVKTFYQSEQKYNSNGFAFRYGILMYGSPRTGKTTMSDYICQTFGLEKYVVTLHRNMTDADLVNLLSKVPQRSLILFDELGDQLKSLVASDNVSVTFGGIKTAIAGSTRLANGVLVLITTNKLDFCSKSELVELVRPGRIDKQYEMHDIYGQ